MNEKKDIDNKNGLFTPEQLEEMKVIFNEWFGEETMNNDSSEVTTEVFQKENDEPFLRMIMEDQSKVLSQDEVNCLLRNAPHFNYLGFSDESSVEEEDKKDISQDKVKLDLEDAPFLKKDILRHDVDMHFAEEILRKFGVEPSRSAAEKLKRRDRLIQIISENIDKIVKLD